MRLDKTFARILLIFSTANVVLAAPAVVRQRSFVTDRSDDESTDKSTPLLAKAIDSYHASQSSATSGSVPVAQGPAPSLDGSVHQDSVPVSVAPQLNDPAPGSGTLEFHFVPPPYVPPPTLGNPPSQHDLPLGSEATQLHKGPLPGSGSQPIPDDMHPSWYDWRPNTEIEEVVNPVQKDPFDMKQFLDNFEVNPNCGLGSVCSDWSDLTWDTSHVRWR